MIHHVTMPLHCFPPKLSFFCFGIWQLLSILVEQITQNSTKPSRKKKKLKSKTVNEKRQKNTNSRTNTQFKKKKKKKKLSHSQQKTQNSTKKQNKTTPSPLRESNVKDIPFSRRLSWKVMVTALVTYPKTKTTRIGT